jgi:hypothetical protein
MIFRLWPAETFVKRQEDISGAAGLNVEDGSLKVKDRD